MSLKIKYSMLFCILSAVLFLFINKAATNELMTSDEIAYKNYTKIISVRGVEGFRGIVDWYCASEENRYQPAPTRLGFILPLVFLFKFFPNSISTIAFVSFVEYFCFLLISFYFCRKFFGENIALGFSMLASASPLIMAMGKSGLTDSLTNLLWGTAIWLFLDHAKNQQIKSYWILLAVLSWAFLVREATIILILFLVLAAWLYRVWYGGSFSLSKIIAMVAVPIVSAFLVYFSMLGMDWGYFEKLINALYLTHFKDHSNAYAILLSSGPWFRYLIDFMLLAPAVTLFAVGYAFKIVIERKNITWEKFFLLLYLLSMLGMFSIFPHSKVVRFVTNLDMVLCLFATFMVYEIFKEDANEQNLLRILVTLVILFVLSLSGFYHIFLASGRVVDPITRDLLIPQGFIPPSTDSVFFQRKFEL